MAYRPPHVNQFRDAAGREWPPTIWPDGTVRRYSGNCGPAAGAMSVLFGSAGVINATPPEMRLLTGVKGYIGSDGKLKGQGTTITDNVRSITAKGVAAQAFSGMAWDRVIAMLADPLVVVTLLLDYEFIPDRFSCQPTFDDGHFIVLFGGKIRGGKILASDPICRERKEIGLGPLKESAGKASSGGTNHASGWIVQQSKAQGEAGSPPRTPSPRRLRTTATHFCHRSRAALRLGPNRSQPAMLAAESGDVARLGRGRIGSPYEIDGYRSSVWLEVHSLNGRHVPTPLWSEALRWAPLLIRPPLLDSPPSPSASASPSGASSGPGSRTKPARGSRAARPTRTKSSPKGSSPAATGGQVGSSKAADPATDGSKTLADRPIKSSRSSARPRARTSAAGSRKLPNA